MSNLQVVVVESYIFELFKNREKVLFISQHVPFVPWERGTSFLLRSKTTMEEIEVLIQHIEKRMVYTLTITDARSSGCENLHNLHSKLYQLGLSSYDEVVLTTITLFVGS